MKTVCLFFALIIFSVLTVSGQENMVSSEVYPWADIKMKKTKYGKKGLVLSGATRDMKDLTIEGLIVNKGKSIDEKLGDPTYEKLVIVKSGQLSLSLNGKTSQLDPGSVAVILPGESFEITNNADGRLELFFFQFYARADVDMARGEKEGGSFVRDWNEITFKPHDRGGIRNYFNQPTAMIKRFEMHVTNLNGKIKSHEPHTHRAAEFVLMIKGNTEMQIADDFYQGTVGDLYYLGSDVSHAIRNLGEEQCMYFAFQYE